ncbi:mitochondrial sterol-4-alpha-carboxylate 3-dehydrogenase (decarboxylating) [Andalucia godoyi]|uniref:Mitochondrial sterol-4-alpha-carboxylate 3-dehydrogenase (Decarboxylating) n=1 Tax=Andalucia godoyi TaxID=505711 RepID=A0A8K0F0I1_ANDGO|nr:mitochondrial sterol-4-alpha-carboxylate 3-dehydrogenase (decarboxylating) [Andalucia godoyi]|eukprot:ANDGO_00830.mRNA.1 mitochondrial sterol-4-alpha-carboxylate 3-dehydrogenase (decarboxylating)
MSSERSSTPVPRRSQTPSMSSRAGKACLVTGGGGFLGRHIAEALVAAGHSVRIFDRVQTFTDSRIDFATGDLTKKSDVIHACEGMDVVFHVASLTDTWGPYAPFYNVNVIGTQNIIEACIKNGIKQLVYTSSPSVVFGGEDIENGDESLAYPATHLNAYCSTKAEAEKLVRAANGKDGLLTVSLRPHAMFGPRDNHFFPQLFEKAKKGQVKYMVGSAQNIVDFTYVGNVVQAHLLAMDKLVEGSPVCGQAYFITNGEPIKFWDFMNKVLAKMGFTPPTKNIPFSVAYGLAWTFEWTHWFVGKIFNFRPPLNRYMVANMCTHHYFSIEKAKTELGYNPETSLEEAVDLTVAYYKSLELNQK